MSCRVAPLGLNLPYRFWSGDPPLTAPPAVMDFPPSWMGEGGRDGVAKPGRCPATEVLGTAGESDSLCAGLSSGTTAGTYT